MTKGHTYNPFPGLRPYTLNYSPYFSGKERQKHQLFKILGESNFVTVIGGQGVGKTSFVNSKIIPDLLGGQLTKGKNSWKIVSFRPGKNPLATFATALSQPAIVQNEEAERIDPNLSERFEHLLRENNYALIEIIEEFKLTLKANLLIYIDHLDDLLFYAGPKGSTENRDIAVFVKRLVEVANQSAYPIHIITTLRTDVAGHFSIYPEFSEIINKNQFLLSALSTKELNPIFENISKNSGINFDRDLLKHLQAYYNDHPLDLGEFQHAMKRSVERWHAEGSKGSVNLEHLNKVGGLNATIQHQLDNIYGYMSSENKKACRLMFQAITETSVIETIHALPRSIADIALIADQPISRIIEVVSPFIDEICGVITKYDPQNITGRLEKLNHATAHEEELITEYSEVTISQDLLFEEWPRLKKWIKEEHLNSNIIKDIAKDAGHDDPPYEGEKLLSTWKWYKEVQPHAGWAEQYTKNFAIAESFLLRSKELSNREVERRASEELSREQSTKRNRNIKIIFSLIALVLVAFAFFKTQEASEAAQDANKQQLKALEATEEAQKAKEEAKFEKRTAELSILQASRDRELAQEALDSAEQATEIARVAKEEAMQAQSKAKRLRNEANQLTQAVKAKNKELSIAEVKISESKIKEDYLGILETVRELSDVAIKDLNRSNDPYQRLRAAKMAAAAYDEFQKIRREKYQNISDTSTENTKNKLFSAMALAYQEVGGAKQLSKVINGITMSKNNLVKSQKGTAEYIIGSNDQRSSIHRVSIENGKVQQTNFLASAEIPEKNILGIKDLSYSNSAKHFLVSHLPIDQNNRSLSKYDYEGNFIKSQKVPSLINKIIPIGDNDYIGSNQNGDILLIEGANDLIKISPLYSAKKEILTLDFHEKSGQLFLAIPQKKIILLNLQLKNAKEQTIYNLPELESEIAAVKYVDTKKWLIVGTINGGIYVYDAMTKRCIYRTLYEHSGYINCIVINEEEELMVTAGRDKILNVWNLEELVPFTSGNTKAKEKYQPIEFEETESIRDVSFLDENWILVVYSTEGLSTGKGGVFLLPLDFDITGRELKKIVNK
ncbi:MAG: hypothetical protein ACI9XJ_001801 [Marivirga sp.]